MRAIGSQSMSIFFFFFPRFDNSVSTRGVVFSLSFSADFILYVKKWVLKMTMMMMKENKVLFTVESLGHFCLDYTCMINLQKPQYQRLSVMTEMVSSFFL